jgi:autotransporter-associated beta strand protein
MILLVVCLSEISGQAATRIWTGGHASSANWNLRDNWGGLAVPTHGDILVFPSGAARLVNTNNIAGLRLHEIQFLGLGGGYNLRGASLAVSNGITVAADAVNTLSVTSVTLHASQALSVASGGQLTVNSDLVLSNANLTLAGAGDFSLRGGISGGGDVIKIGAGYVTYFGEKDNTYRGTTFVNAGTLALNQRETVSIVPLSIKSRIAVPGNLIVGDGTHAAIARLNHDDQIANTATVTVREGSELRFFGNRDALTDVVLQGGAITMDVGSLVLNGDITSLPSSVAASIGGQVVLNNNSTFTVDDGAASVDLEITAKLSDNGGQGFTKAGAGTLRLGGTNVYGGQTVISSGLVRIANDRAFGSANKGTTVSDGAALQLDTAVNTLREPLTIEGAGIGGTSGAIRIGSGATIATNIVLSAPATINTIGGGNLVIEGEIDGTGPLTKTGLGTLELAGKSPNSYSGSMLAKEGVLLLSKTLGASLPGDLIIGTTNTAATVRHTRSGNVSGAVTVYADSRYDLDGNNETIDSLTLLGGGGVETRTGLLTVDSSITARGARTAFSDNAVITGRLRLGSGAHARITSDKEDDFPYGVAFFIHAQVSGTASIIKDGPEMVTLTASNIFTGSFTVVEGELAITDDHALGSPDGDTIVGGNGILRLVNYVHVEDERLFLDSSVTNRPGAVPPLGALVSMNSNSWSGTVFLSKTATIGVNTNSTLNLSGSINGFGGLIKAGVGTLLYSGTRSNAYIGATTINEGLLRLERGGGPNRSISGPLIVGDGVGGLQADVVEVHSPSQINDLAAVTVSSSGALRFLADDIIGSLSGSGRVGVLGGGTELTAGQNGGSTTYGGNISGSGSLRKSGAGTLTLTGTNVYTGDTLVDEGTLLVNGEQPDSDIYVGPAGTLSGIGTVGNLSVAGTLRPGNPRGRLDIASVNFLPNSTFAIDLQHTTSEVGFYPSHNWFRSSGAVDVTGANLEVSLGFAPLAGQTFILGNKTQPGLVTGTFTGRPEGAVMVRNDIPLRLTYTGDTGNDIVLAVGELPLQVAATRIEAGNGNGRIDPNECNELFVVIENVSALALNDVTARVDSVDPRVAVTRAESDYGDIPGLISRTNRTAFQIRIASGYPCASAVDLHLVIHSANHGPFALPIRLLAGTPGDVQIVESTDVPRFVPDLGAVQSTIDWPNNFQVGRVRVKIHATHFATGNLRFRLRNPAGEEVLLAANRGGAGNNYGINCESPTVFDDDAVVNIAGASAPFAGTFAPESNLSPFVNRFSGGIWTLTVEDTVAGNVGALQCWSLELARAICTDGGGGCESCTTQLTGSFSESTPAMPKRLAAALVPSGCGNINHCPGTTSETGPFRYQTHSFTNEGPETCVTVLATVPCGGWSNALFFSAHLGEVDPADLCGNYLGDVGQGIHSYYGEGSAFSFPVPAGARFTLLVAERTPQEGCGSYGLELFGLPCPQEQPRLLIANDAGPDNVRLHWSTAYPGFDLQGKSTLGGNGVLSVFTNVFTPPVVVGGHYSITNKHDGKANGFFRLRKP